MSSTPLSQLPLGKTARVISVDLPSAIKQRMMEMGLTPGTSCTLIRFAPLGDPMELKVRGYHLSIRKSEAQGILVEPV